MTRDHPAAAVAVGGLPAVAAAAASFDFDGARFENGDQREGEDEEGNDASHSKCSFSGAGRWTATNRFPCNHDCSTRAKFGARSRFEEDVHPYREPAPDEEAAETARQIADFRAAHRRTRRRSLALGAGSLALPLILLGAWAVESGVARMITRSAFHGGRVTMEIDE